MKYENLDWASLEYLKAHLYKRIANPLIKVLDVLEQAKQSTQVNPERLARSHHAAQAMLNTLNAWATLINYRHNGSLSGFQYKKFTKADFPEWLKLALEQYTSLRLEFDQAIEIHPETFLESLLLLYQVMQSVSQVAHIQLSDAPAPKQGVYLRVVFSYPEQAPLASLMELQNQFDLENAAEHDMALQLMVARDMMALNRARFSLQNNKKTGQQALSAYFMAVVEEATASDPLGQHRPDFVPAPTLPIEVTSTLPLAAASEITIVVETPPLPPSQPEAEPQHPPLPDRRLMQIQQLTTLMEEEPTDLEAIKLSILPSLPSGDEAKEGQEKPSLKKPSGDGSPNTSFSW
jgi:hypothetical protein